jgi:hypothetical protein
MYSTTFTQQALANGFSVGIDTHSGCPYAKVFVETFELPNKTASKSCNELYTNTEAALLSAPAGHVFIGVSSAYWGSNVNQSVSLTNDATNFTNAGKEEAMRLGILAAVRKLIAHGHIVTLIEPIYSFSQPWSGLRVEGCSTFNHLIDRCATSKPASNAAPWDIAAKVTVSRLSTITGLSGVTLMSTGSIQCPAGICVTKDEDNVPVFADSNHLSLEYVPVFAGSFERMLRQ